VIHTHQQRSRLGTSTTRQQEVETHTNQQNRTKLFK